MERKKNPNKYGNVGLKTLWRFFLSIIVKVLKFKVKKKGERPIKLLAIKGVVEEVWAENKSN